MAVSTAPRSASISTRKALPQTSSGNRRQRLANVLRRACGSGKRSDGLQAITVEEARQNYEAAYEAYRRAYAAEPSNTQYKAALTRLRYLAAEAKVHRATLLRETGRLEEALHLFDAAVDIDPSSPIAAQEADTTRKMIQRASAHKPEQLPPRQPALSSELLEAQGPVKLAGLPKLPLTLKITGDTKVVYHTIAQLTGLNLLFDPDYISRQMNVELNGVSLEEALDLVAAESRTFWHPMTPNTIFVAADNAAKRKELEQSVVRTFYISNLTTPNELQDIVNTLRSILEVSRIQPLPSQEAIVIRGTPDQVLLAEKIINDFDTVAPEVMIDIAIMQVSRDKLHNLGINPATKMSVQLESNTSSSSSNNSSNNSSSNSTPTINLNSLANLNATDFTATISSASINALLSDSRTKILQNPQLRSRNGQKASLKIGDRVPTATGSYQPSISGVSVSTLVNTQFQYVDVGVNVDITPYIHADGGITLKVVLDVSSVTSYVSIGGINQPVIGQRKVEHEIRLKNGEVNLLGGMLEQQDTKSISGFPGFSEIPILKYLFSEKTTEVKDNEIVFALIPHIIRKRDFGELSGKTLDVGNANSIHLRRAQSATTDSRPSEAPGRGSE